MKTEYGKERTIKEGFETEEFVKCADMLGTYEKDRLYVVGIMENPKSKHGTSYALAIIDSNKGMYFMNIPKWLGESISDDFANSEQTVDEYFNTSIKTIEKMTTNKGDSIRITFY